MALLSYLLGYAKMLQKTQKTLFLAHSTHEISEMGHLAKLFLSKDIQVHTLPDKEEREEAKVEWMIQLIQKNEQKHIFFMSEEEVKRERFPSLEKLKEESIILEKGEEMELLRLTSRLGSMGFDISPDVSLQKGQYRRSGDCIDIFPVGAEHPVKIEIEFDVIKNIYSFDSQNKSLIKTYSKLTLFPAKAEEGSLHFYEFLEETALLVRDDIEELPEDFLKSFPGKQIQFTPFPEEESKKHHHLRFLGVLKFYNLYDLLSDLKDKLEKSFEIVLFSKRREELKNIFIEEGIPFFEEEEERPKKKAAIQLVNAEEAEVVPPSFQNPDQGLLFLTDREIFQLRRAHKQKSISTINNEFLTSLKVGDFVVHLDHGIGRFLGVTEQEIDGHLREYLEIAYAKDDRLFVPVDQASKVSRYLHEEGNEPRLTRLGSVEWENIQRKAKKETEKVAKELLKLYAEREQSKKDPFAGENKAQEEFEKTFPYEETPGQMSAISDVKKDMESDKPMDRLVCGDVGFGKTEVALRAAFKAVQSGKQVAVISPLTILASQHFDSFQKRMKAFDVRIALLSRFQTKPEQKKILEQMKKGLIDIVIGTHRLLQTDIAFRDLGLLIVDEEQRFGVKQKEKIKAMRKNVDILTLTATPIPRTLNLAMNKLRDISTITTPPPGRLPVITEVRKHTDKLVQDAVRRELEREGQVYFLHNRVQTIESMAERLRKLVPEAKVVVGHGQLTPQELEKRILGFKEGRYNILVSSTIIENGIDLSNANTIIVMNAERFGLSQLYQLRGRIGRSKRQGYAYFLYQTQRLNIEAKKRLKAIVEASELGSGFQIAMRDLEIRGAGDVLGVQQSGAVNAVGVSHFLRLLQQTISEMRNKKKISASEEKEDTLVELPIDAYIPSFYIADSKEKILAYQNLSAVKNEEELQEIADDFREEYGQLPKEVRALLQVIKLKLAAREANITTIRSVPTGKHDREIQLTLGKNVTAGHIMNLLKEEEKWLFSGDRLKIPFKELGMDFMGNIERALKLLAGGKKIEAKAPPKKEAS